MTQTIEPSVFQELLDLCDDGDTSLIAELIGLYLADSPARIAEALDGIRTGDLERVERAAHTLKGSSGNLGAMLLMETAEQLQLASRAGDAQRVAELGPTLAARFEIAADALRNLLAQYSR